LPERSVYRRDAMANRAFPQAVMKLAQVAVESDGKVYYISGLDGYVLHLLKGRNEILSFDVDGQVRDLACSDEPHTVYYSVVPTPQDGAPLADGKIFRRDIWAGRPNELATIRQSQVDGNWWGTFTIRDGVVYLATLEDSSRIFKLTGSGAELAFGGCGFRIQGLTTGPDGRFYFTDGSDKVYRTADFHDIEPVFRGGRNFTDVSFRADASQQ